MAKLEQMLDKNEILAKIGVSKATFWRMVRDGRLPKARKFGERTSRWALSEIIECLQNPKPKGYFLKS